MPELFVITGANGAGKSTLSKALLPQNLQYLPVFDGDKLFLEKLSQIFPSHIKSPKYARDEAFRQTVEEFERLQNNAIQANQSFCYEGHFSAVNAWQTIRLFKENNYQITMVFLMLSDLSVSLRRVTDRVKSGGHFVTPIEIEKNYFGNLIQLNRHFELIDELYIIDNSSPIFPTLILSLSNGKVIENLAKSNLPKWFDEYLPNLYKKL
jgi:predicted ABC-type ATPase